MYAAISGTRAVRHVNTMPDCFLRHEASLRFWDDLHDLSLYFPMVNFTPTTTICGCGLWEAIPTNRMRVYTQSISGAAYQHPRQLT